MTRKKGMSSGTDLRNHIVSNDQDDDKPLLYNTNAVAATSENQVLQFDNPMIFGASKDSGHVFRANLSGIKNSFAGIFLHLGSRGTKEGDEPYEREYNKKKNKRFGICKPQRVVLLLLEDWLFLAVLGVVMAFLSLVLDTGVEYLHNYHSKLMEWVDVTNDETTNVALKYLAWMIYSMALLMLATILTHYVSIQAIGSGIPETKTILQGVSLENYLSFRTLVAKVFGLTLAIGSGFPIGKEGPFVHMGSIVAHQLRRLVQGIKPAYANESRSYELLAAGCAAGVAATFSAPVGGVLFSIEVTTAYFAVRDYWRGFFAAACGSAVFSLLRLYTHPAEVTVAAIFQTRFRHRSYYPEELLIFALIGAFCGAAGATFILIHRRYVLFLRRNSIMKRIFQRNWVVYPVVIAAIYSTITYPYGFGQYLTGQVVFSHSLRDFFINCTWHVDVSHMEACGPLVTTRWSANDTIFNSLALFIVAFYFLAIVASTLPVPAGIFMPSFVIGAAMGRFFGEVMAHAYPNGVRNDKEMLIYPGIYAVVGAVSFCGAVTHTVSVAVIAFELTGQLLHMLPVMIAVIIANIVCSSFQPSFFDSIIKIKHLPYLPDIPKSTSEVHEIRVAQIMVRNVEYLSKKTTYFDLQDVLSSLPKIPAFPVVDNPESMVLLGSVSRENLLRALSRIIGDEECRLAIRSKDLTVINGKTDEQMIGNATKRFTVEAVQLSPETTENLPKMQLEESRIPRRSSLEFLRKKTPKLKTSLSDLDMRRKRIIAKRHGSNHDFYETLGSVFKTITCTLRGKKRSASEDLGGEERKKWEQEQLSKEIDFMEATLDPAPFQLVEDTSLYKVHSIFSLLGIRRAYVTKCGVLVGVVSLREIATAIELAQAGLLTASTRRREAEHESGDQETGITGEPINFMDMETIETESETDNEDVIMPHVEVEREPSVDDLEAKFAALQARVKTEYGELRVRERRKSYPNIPGRKVPKRMANKRPIRQSLDILPAHKQSTKHGKGSKTCFHESFDFSDSGPPTLTGASTSLTWTRPSRHVSIVEYIERKSFSPESSFHPNAAPSKLARTSSQIERIDDLEAGRIRSSSTPVEPSVYSVDVGPESADQDYGIIIRVGSTDESEQHQFTGSGSTALPPSKAAATSDFTTADFADDEASDSSNEDNAKDTKTLHARPPSKL